MKRRSSQSHALFFRAVASPREFGSLLTPLSAVESTAPSTNDECRDLAQPGHRPLATSSPLEPFPPSTHPTATAHGLGRRPRPPQAQPLLPHSAPNSLNGFLPPRDPSRCVINRSRWRNGRRRRGQLFYGHVERCGGKDRPNTGSFEQEAGTRVPQYEAGRRRDQVDLYRGVEGHQSRQRGLWLQWCVRALCWKYEELTRPPGQAGTRKSSISRDRKSVV